MNLDVMNGTPTREDIIEEKLRKLNGDKLRYFALVLCPRICP